MTISKDVGRAPWASSLTGRAKAIASRFVASSEPRFDDEQFGQIAKDPNRSIPKNEIQEIKDIVWCINATIIDCTVNSQSIKTFFYETNQLI